jgi:hypothetical protein
MPYVPTPPPGPESVILDKFIGLKNTVDPERLKPTELSRAQNIDLDDVGEPHRRRGYTLKLGGSFHSLFTTSTDQTFVVKDGALGVVNPGYSFVPVGLTVGTDPLAYVQVGPILYFSSRSTSGQIDLTGVGSTRNVQKLAEDGSIGLHFGGFNSTPHVATAGTVMVFSALLKAVERSSAILYSTDSINPVLCEFDILNGIAGTPSFCTSTIAPVGNGWFAVTLTWTMLNDQTPQFVVLTCSAFGGGFADASYAGVIGDGVLVDAVGWTENGGPSTSVDISSTVSGATVGPFSISSIVSPWGAQNDQGFWFSPVVSPTLTSQPIAGRLFGAPPLATALTYFNGRIYLASDRTLWMTELHLYNFTDKTRDHFLFESPITVLGTVTDGIYVGTTSDIWFLSPTLIFTPKGRETLLKRIAIMNVGAIPGTMISVPAELVHPVGQGNPDQPIESKNAVVFMTESGIVVGLDAGQTFNLTQTDFLFPAAASGAAFFRRQDGVNSYISVLDSRGTPNENARFGDHLDAVLIRGPGVVT